MINRTIFLKHVAVPSDHGSWVFLVSPLLIGGFLGGRWTIVTLYLVVASLMGFFLRQPITHLIKIHAGRRPRSELVPAVVWTLAYSAVGSVHVVGLVLRGYAHLLWLVLPGMLVFSWHLALVWRKRERHQLGVEILATGVLSLVAPAAFWIGTGQPDRFGWLLWVLVWLQAIASIMYVHLRLDQRKLGAVGDLRARARLGIVSLRWTTFNVVLVAVLAMAEIVPPFLLAPYMLQWLEGIRGILVPARKGLPAAIGIRQLVVTTLFTVLFILAY
jgi:hypothetical protein